METDHDDLLKSAPQAAALASTSDCMSLNNADNESHKYQTDDASLNMAHEENRIDIDQPEQQQQQQSFQVDTSVQQHSMSIDDEQQQHLVLSMNDGQFQYQVANSGENTVVSNVLPMEQVLIAKASDVTTGDETLSLMTQLDQHQLQQQQQQHSLNGT